MSFMKYELKGGVYLMQKQHITLGTMIDSYGVAERAVGGAWGGRNPLEMEQNLL